MRQTGPGEIERELCALEHALLDANARRQRATVNALLAPDFCEFGSSGRVYNKTQTLDALQNETPREYTVTDFAVALVGPDAALVRYRVDAPAASLRSSLWVRRNGRWLMLFHQGTPFKTATSTQTAESADRPRS